MKKKMIPILLLILSIQSYSQYEEKTIKELNFAPNDSLIHYGTTQNTEPAPQLLGDTIIVTGVVMNAPYFNANVADDEMLSGVLPISVPIYM